MLFGETQSVKDDERVLREVQLLFVRRREQFHNNTGRIALFRAWNDLLADATEKVYRDRRDAEAFAAEAQSFDDADRDFYEATRRIAGRATEA